MKLNKKGFTLVELLAVIVILAVVMLIAVTAIGPVMQRATKGGLSSTAQQVAEAASQAVLADQMYATKKFYNGNTYCVDLSELTSKNFLDTKGKSYYGSVKITLDSSGKATYNVYIQEQNTNMYINGDASTELGVESVKEHTSSDKYTDIDKCGNANQAMTTLNN